jgi:spore coat protein CotH
VDVASFARYVALQNLLLNFDDMAGPGKNYYLFYDLDRKRFQVITWDLNLAFGGDPAQGPFDPGRLGGRGPGGPGAVPGPPPPGAVPGPPPGGGVVGGGGFRTGHRLKERFLVSFRPVYETTYKQLYQKLFASGAAIRVLDQVAAQAGTAEAAAAQSLRTTINARTQALAAFAR